MKRPFLKGTLLGVGLGAGGMAGFAYRKQIASFFRKLFKKE